MASYLHDRHQTVVIENYKSQPAFLEYSVPQGSVLGFKLYSLYTKLLANILENIGGNHHFFTDDSQLYRFFELKNEQSI